LLIRQECRKAPIAVHIERAGAQRKPRQCVAPGAAVEFVVEFLPRASNEQFPTFGRMVDEELDATLKCIEKSRQSRIIKVCGIGNLKISSS